MSKSLGNVLSVPHILEAVRPVELRYYLGSAHYRSVLEYSEEALQEAAAGYRRIEAFLKRAADKFGEIEIGDRPEAFDAAMNEDLAVPRALAELHNAVRAGNQLLADGDDARAKERASEVRAMAAVLGFDPLSEKWAASGGGDDRAMHALGVLIGHELETRKTAREEKDWATADGVRDRLTEAGVSVTDTADGPKWSLSD